MTANGDVADSFEAGELLEDDGPMFLTCGKLSFDRGCSEDVDVELDSNSASRGSTSSLNGSIVCEGTEESRQQHAESEQSSEFLC